MPDLEQQKKTAVATDVATSVPTTTTGPTSKESLRMRAGTVGYADGEAMLKPDKAPVPDPAKKAEEDKKKEEQRAAAAKKSYEQALGKFLGGKLFDLIHKELSAEKLLGYGKDGVKAMGSVTDAIKPTDKGAAGGIMDEAAEAAAAKAFADALMAWTQGEATKWLEGDDGKALLTKINNWTEGHPKTVALALVGAALAAATYAYTSNMSIPQIDQEFDLGKGFKAKLGGDLGKIQDIALKAAELGISYQADGFSAGLSGTYKKTDQGDQYGVNATANLEKDGHKADASAAYNSDGSKKAGVGYKFTGPGDKPLSVGTRGDAVVDADGNLVVTAQGEFNKGDFASSISSSRQSDAGGKVTDQKTTAALAWGDPANRHNVDGIYDHTKNQFTLSTANTRIFEGEGYKLTRKDSYTPEGKNTDVSGTLKPNAATTVSMGVNQTGDKTNSGNLGVGYSKDWLKAQLDLKMADGKSSLSGSASATKGNFTATGNIKVNLDDARLTELGLKLGWKDPDAFRSFLVEYKRSWVEANQSYSDKFDLMLEQSLGQVAFRVQGNASLQGGQVQNAGVKGMAAYTLNKDLKLLGGAGYDYQAPGVNGDLGLNKGNGATIYGGVQFRDVPITVGYRPSDKAWTIGLQIKF